MNPTRSPWASIAVFGLANLTLVCLLSLPFLLDLAPSLVLATLVPAAQWSVALIALVVNRAIRRGDLRDLMAMRRGPSLRTGLLWMLGAGCLVPLVQLALGLGAGLTGWQLHDGWHLALVSVPVFVVLQSLFGAGEELGWRGFLHTLLRRRAGFWTTVGFTAVLWGLWHVPVALDLALDGELPTRMAITYVLDILPWAVLLGALRERFDSVWPAVLGHGLLNSVRVFLLQNFTTAESQLSTVGFWGLHATGWVLWILAGMLVLRTNSPTRTHLEAPLS